jgi:hypothetical protein
MFFKTGCLFSHLGKFFMSAGLVSLMAFCSMHCNSNNNPVAPANKTALTLVSPVGGEHFSFTDTIIVKWIANVDSLGLPDLLSYAKQFSLDSGKSWIELLYPAASGIADSNVYQITWKGLDTTQVDPITYQPLTKTDFLNKGILVHIVSYPPKKITRVSGFFFFHE